MDIENAIEIKNVEMHFNMSKEKLESLKEYFLRLFRALQVLVGEPFYSHCGQSGVAEKRVVGVVYKVLEHNHSETITIVVKAFGLDLYVLSQGIEPEGFHSFNVMSVALRSFGQEYSVLKISLVKETVEKVGLAVETHSRRAVYRLDLKSAESKIRLNRVTICGYF